MGKPINLTFKFPREKTTVISKMLVTIGDNTIEAKVMDEDKADEKFDDAMAEG